MSSSSSSSPLLCVGNIPSSFHTHDLRRFFSSHVESGAFDIFHFRHRPQGVSKGAVDVGNVKECKQSTLMCCYVRAVDESRVKSLLSAYHGVPWTDSNLDMMDVTCSITRLDNLDDEEHKHYSSMKELRAPPSVMPNGNVGTTTAFFLQAVQECRLPLRLIAQLRLEFPRMRRRRKYTAVQFDYGQANKEGRSLVGEHAGRQQDHVQSGQDRLRGDQLERISEDGKDDDDGGEEWERHESLNDHVPANRVNPTFISQVPGTKERLYEEEQEVTWEKGGSGLVFYTDAQLRKSNDFDVNTTDDWDIDTSIYYEKGAGDKDARDVFDMRKAERRRKGLDNESAFKPSSGSRVRPSGRVSGHKIGRQRQESNEIGRFGNHTKGFGRRIMEKHGWKDGQGLGSSTKGMAEALHCDGQTNRSGLGYRGERIAAPYLRPSESKSRRRSDIDDVIISTKYDKATELDPEEPLLRSNPQVYLKHRCNSNTRPS